MDLTLLTGQRPADVLKIKREHIRGGALFIAQNKTGAKRAIDVVGELAQVLDRIAARERERLSAFPIQDDNGRPLTMLALRGRFDKARKAAGVAFPVPRHPRKDHKRYRQPCPLAAPAGAQDPRRDRALRARAHWAARQAT